MFKEHDINGEQGLLYLLKDSEVLQSFHLAMLTTNAHIGAIPLQCTYVENREAIYYKTGHLISVERYLHENRVIHLSWIMKGLAETVKQLMAHQLFPENMCLDSQYIFLDLNSRKVHLIYIPLKTQIYEAKSKLVHLLRQWLDQYVNQCTQAQQGGVDFNPMMMKLVLSLQQETTSFSGLLDIMCDLGASTQEKYTNTDTKLDRFDHLVSGSHATINQNQKAYNASENLREAMKEEYEGSKVSLRKSEGILSEKSTTKLKVPKFSTALKKQKSGSKDKGSRSVKGLIMFIPLVIVIAGLLLSPLALETKVGGTLILCAGSVWCIQKFKLIQITTNNEKSRETKCQPCQTPLTEYKPFNDSQPRTMSYCQNLADSKSGGIYQNNTSPTTGEYGVKSELVKTDETLWIDQNSKQGVLMLRSELGSKFVTLNKEVTTLGRNPSLCDVMIDEAGVGRIHAEIHKNDDKYYIKDIQSLNGSFVNGKKIPSNQYYELKTGDQIKIGSKEVIFT